ncbi:MAG: YggT family protein [Anaerolineae bacterium]
MISLYRFIGFIFWVLDLAILLRVLFSWINADPSNVLVQLVYQITEPILAPLRRLIPPIAGLDITPIVALVLLELLERFLIRFIF